MEKRGLSDVISAVLLILIVLVSISIIWLFLKPVINQVLGDSGSGNSGTESGEIGKFTSCLKLDLTLTNCNLEDSGIYKVRVERGIGLFDIKEIKFKFKTINTEFILTNNTDFPDEFGSENYYFNLLKYTDEEIMNVEVAAILSNGNACDFSGKYSCFEFIPSGGNGGGGEQICGDGRIEGSEECEGTPGKTCQYFGHEGGVLLCTDCKFDESQCTPGGGGQISDLDYLLDVDVEVITKTDGKKSFTADYNDNGNIKRLRDIYSDEKFFENNGLVEVTYDIVEQIGGVDVVYTVYNPTGSDQEIPDFRIDGILISSNVNDNLQYLKAKSSIGFQDITLLGTNYIDSYYPSNYYSPVVINRDTYYTAGSALEYPYLIYKQNVRTTLSVITNLNSPMYGTWSHRYRDFATDNGAPALIGASQTLQYNVSLRFSDRRNWIFTLYPYKKYFESLYGTTSGNILDRDRTPMLGIQMGDSQLAGSGNLRGYKGISGGVGRIDNLGWQPFTDWFISTASAKHYTRVLIWTPGGVYDQNKVNNFPPQFMSDWLPLVSSTDSELRRYADENIKLGFWWGRSTQIPEPVQWNAPTLLDAVYSNPVHVAFLTNELNLAVGRGAKFIGLDEFTHMPVYQKYGWIDDMENTIAPGVVFSHESTGPDILHRKIANHAVPSVWGDINAPDLLSWYLNPRSEIYVLGAGVYNNLAFMQEMSKWGYTPNPKDTLTIDANEINQPLIKCFDGIDNDNDGKTDIYDLDCIDETGTSES